MPSNPYLETSTNFSLPSTLADGKGRTSLVVCAWLLYKKYYSQLEDAQRFFYDQLNQNKSKATIEPDTNHNLLQTPSQLRYLKYFEQLVSAGMQRPKERSLQLHEIRISCLIGLGQGNGSDLYCVFQINQFEQFHMNFFQVSSLASSFQTLKFKVTRSRLDDLQGHLNTSQISNIIESFPISLSETFSLP